MNHTQPCARLVVLAVLSLAIAGRTLADPTGGEVISGGPVTITPDGTHTRIETTTVETRMRWDGFDIAVDESVHVQQPNTASTLVNHVNDARVTSIDGSLTSNGNVWILNPAGVYFGGSAIVEVAGLVAAAGTITDQAYVMGLKHFTGIRGEVQNAGTIHAGDGGVALIGRAVANHGQIVTRGGDLVLAAGDDVLLMGHDTFIQVHLQGLGPDAERPSVLNTGTLDAGTGRARLAAGDFLGLAIRNQGEIYAKTIEIEAGRESVVEIGGILDATNDEPGAEGGHIEVTGDFVVVDDARIDASGDAGGGELWIGGEAGGGTGQEGELRTARGVYVGDGSEIHADATESGDGGEIIVWGDEVAQVQGRFSARGGPGGGNGGFIETSSKGLLQLSAAIDVGASHGQSGTWLLDPVDIDIVDVLTGSLLEPVFDFDFNIAIVQPDGSVATSEVLANDLEDALLRGGTVVVTTQSSGDDPDSAGDIRVLAPITLTDTRAGDPDFVPAKPNESGELLLLAAGDVVVDAPIESQVQDYSLSVTLIANDNPLTSSDPGAQTEPVDRQASGDVHVNSDITTNGGSVFIAGANVSLDAAIDTTRVDNVGGTVELLAIDAVASGLIEVDPNPGESRGLVALGANARVTTGGGNFTSSGGSFRMDPGAIIDVFGMSILDPTVFLGSALVNHNKTVEVNGTIRGEAVTLGSGADGTEGDGATTVGATAVLRATTVTINAGDGVGGNASDGAVTFEDDPTLTTTITAVDDPNASPDRFVIIQDAPITEANLPKGAAFAGGLDDVSYDLTTREGSETVADILLGTPFLSDPNRFTGASLVLNAPDTIEIGAPLASHDLTLFLDTGFTVTSALAGNLGVDPTDGELVIHAARSGEGDLILEDGITLQAPSIALRAGSLVIGAAGADASSVQIPTGVGFDTASLEIRQDAAIHTDDLPTAGQFMQPQGLSGMEYILASHSGTVTIADATKVDDTKLTALAVQGIVDDGVIIETPDPIEVQTADIGGHLSFEVRETLLDKLIVTGADGDPGERILSLRANAGPLSFAARQAVTDPDTGDIITPSEPLRIFGDRIRLLGATINVATNTPIFQLDASETQAPKSFIFQQTAQINDSSLPTADNFNDGQAPSELFAIHSLDSIVLSQASEPGAARPWNFPLMPDTRVILSSRGISIQRSDGNTLVLGQNDDLWGDEVRLTSFFGSADFRPIADAAVDAFDLNSLRSFDATADFTVSDPKQNVELPEDPVSLLIVDQDAGFSLRTDPNLPDIAKPGVLQPDQIALISQFGSIEIDNTILAGTDLSLEVRGLDLDAPDQFIDFDGSSALVVEKLDARIRGDFRVGADPGNPDGDGVLVVATDQILLTGGSGGTGALTFAPNVTLFAELIELTGGAGDPAFSHIDARTNAPRFVTSAFRFAQNGDIRNGLTVGNRVEWGLLPTRQQFFDLNPLDVYQIQSNLGDVEINDPTEVFIARTVQLLAGSPANPTNLTVRADLANPSCQSTCGTGVGADNLTLIGPITESVEFRGRQIALEAPHGYVDAGDPRASFVLLGSNPVLAVRQLDEILAADAGRLPGIRQVVAQPGQTPYLIQSTNGVTIGSEFADRIQRTERLGDGTLIGVLDLFLLAGVTEEAFAAAERGVRLGKPIPGGDPDDPTPVYDRMADLDHDGVIGPDDDDMRRMLNPSSVAIEDPGNPFDIALRSLTIASNPGDGVPIRLGSVTILTDSDQTYSDEIRLTGDAVLTARTPLESQTTNLTPPGSNITFEETIDGATDGGESLTVNATERIHFMKDIGTGTGQRLGKLEINLQQLLQFQEPPPTPRVEFGVSDVPDDFFVIADEILLNASSGDPGSDFARARVPDAATFFRRGGNLIFDLAGATTTDGGFVMGVNEKLTVDGSLLRIDAPTGNVTIGDLSANDLIDVTAENIFIQRRGKGTVVRANGESLHDNGVDFAAREIRFAFNGSDGPQASQILHGNQIGSGKDARFGIADTAGAPAFMDDFSVLALQFNVLGGGSVPFDGIPDGLSRVQLARVFTPARPDVPIGVPASRRIRRTGALDVLDLRLREPTTQEIRDAARGAATFRDLDSLSASGDLRVSESRLVAEEVEETARLYLEVFGENGESVPQIRASLQSAIDDYKRSTGARRVVGFELRRYVYNRPSSQFHAYQQLQELDALFRHHRRSGLTRSEYGAIQSRWLEAIQPDGISVRELSEFIHPSRYIRDRDVLDVFAE